MNVVARRDPFAGLFGDIRSFVLQPSTTADDAGVLTLKVDVKETAEAYSVHADLPGVSKAAIQIDVDGAVVSISAEKKRATEATEGERALRTERFSGKVARSFRLSQDIDETRVEARFTDGVLELTLPKKVATPARKITVQ